MIINLEDFKESVADTMCNQYVKMRNYITQNEEVVEIFTDYVNGHMSLATTQIDDRKLFLKRTPVFDEIIGDTSKFGFIVENYSRKVNIYNKPIRMF